MAAIILSSLQNMLFTATQTLTSPNPIPDQNQIFLTLFVQIIIAKFFGNKLTQYKDNACEIVNTPDSLRIFDYIIVGSGSAGSVAISRITENKTVTGLVIEGGCTDPLLASFPPLFFPVSLKTDVDWNFRCIDQNIGLSIVDRGWTPRGRMFCGSAALNFNFNFFGNPNVYNDWETKYGCKGWSYKDVLPYFKKSETNTDKTLNAAYHGQSGPITTSYYYYDYGSDLILNGVNQSGVPIVKDMNEPHGECVGRATGTLKDGRRDAVCTAYVNPHQYRPNLKIMKCAIVTRVLFTYDENGKPVASGVEVYYKGKLYVIKARYEVILCAGVFGTAEILQRSGIGRESDLNEIGVDPLPIDELDVGYNLLDHFSAWTFWSMSGESDSLLALVKSITDYYKTPPTGPIAGMSTLPMVAYFDIPIEGVNGEIEIAEFEYYEPAIKLFLIEQNKKSMTLLILNALQNPKCAGNCKAKTTNPVHDPRIFFNYLCNDHNDFDRRALIKSLERLEKIGDTPAWKAVNAKPLRLSIPACNGFDMKSDSYYNCLVKNIGHTTFHPVGTCRMGPAPPAVCNNHGQVFGVDRLSAMDASTFPYIPNCNTNRPTVMTAEKDIAEMKKRHGWEIVD